MEKRRLHLFQSMLRILVFIFVPLLIAVVFTAYGLDLFTGGGYGPNFSFLETPSISGTNGVVFTKYEDLDGKVWWNTEDRTVRITIRCKVRGFGDFSSTITDIEFADDTYSISQGEGKEIGSWGELIGTLPTSVEAIYAIEHHSWTKTSPEEEGTYTWSAGGYTTLVPYKWKWRLSFSEITGEWKKMPATIESASSTSGTWTVDYKYVCPVCKVESDSKNTLSPGHDKLTCKREGCNESFRNCERAKVAKHSIQASCEVRNVHGVQCDVTTFWGCEDPPHTHDYGEGSGSDQDSGGGEEVDEPSLVQCDRFGCTEMVPTGRHHRKQCSTQDETGAPGCGVWIWTCKSSNARHVAHECSKVIYEGNDSHGCTVYVRQCTSHSGRHTISTPTLHRNNQNP